MKKNLFLLFTLSILYSCVDKANYDPQTDSDLKSGTEVLDNKKAQDTIFNYWEINLDTISDRKEFLITDQRHILELETYSLNDSSVVRNLGIGDSQAYLDHSHKIVTDIKLSTDSKTDQKRIDKTDFKKSLEPQFYRESNLFSTQIDSIKEDQIYLTSDLAIPDTDNQWRVWYSIKIINNQLDKIEIHKTDYVGL